MSMTVTLNPKGLFTNYNALSQVESGSLLRANNIVIDEKGIAKSRRGIKYYSDLFSDTTQRAKQLLEYKDKLLVHVKNKISLDNGAGVFSDLSGIIYSASDTARIKSVEYKGNLYLTTDKGIKKISAASSSELTASSVIQKAGAPISYGMSVELVKNSSGILDANKHTAYRVTWGIKDESKLTIEGVPSYFVEASNPTAFSKFAVNCTLYIPTDVTTSHFFRLYRCETRDVGDALSTEYNLIKEGTPTTVEITQGYVEYFDTISEDVRLAGLPLYTNPYSGEGETASNYAPPFATDIAKYQNHVFYANTRLNHIKTISLNSLANFKSANTNFIIKSDKPATQAIYKLTSGSTKVQIDPDYDIKNIRVGMDIGGTGIPSSTRVVAYDYFNKEITISNAATLTTPGYNASLSFAYERIYTFMGQKEISQVIIPGSNTYFTNGDYFLLNSANNERRYYIIYKVNGTTLIPNNLETFGRIPVVVDISLATTAALVAKATSDVINALEDFTASIDPVTTNKIYISTIKNGQADATADSVFVDTHSLDITTTASSYTIKPTITALFSTTLDSNIIIPSDLSIIDKLNVGGSISGSGILAGSTIQAIYPTSFAISSNATATQFNSVFRVTSFYGLQVNRTKIYSSVFTGGYATVNTINSASDTVIVDKPASSAVTNYTTTYENSFITGNTFSTLQQGLGEELYNRYVLLEDSTNTAVDAYDLTLRSLVDCINNDPLSFVTASYLGNKQIALMAKDIDDVWFVTYTSDLPTAQNWSPALSSTSNYSDATKNSHALYFSKQDQPESVPLLNNFMVGGKDEPILRIIPLRESLFIFKTDGIYRLSGYDKNSFSVVLFDSTAILKAPDSASVLRNQVYFFGSQGVARVSEGGVEKLSNPIDDKLIPMITTCPKLDSLTFSVAYETDQSYLLWTALDNNNTIAQVCYRYNLYTDSWVEWKIPKTCAILKSSEDKLFFGSGAAAVVEIERKDFGRFDYADREIQITLPSTSVSGNILKPSGASQIEAGDMLYQLQGVTISQYNQVIKMLASDPSFPENVFLSYEAKSGDSMHVKVTSLCAYLNTLDDSGWIDSHGNTSYVPPELTTVNAILESWLLIIDRLNESREFFYSNYPSYNRLTPVEARVLSRNLNNNAIELEFEYPFVEGDMLLYKAITTDIEFVPQAANDPSSLKQFQACQMIFKLRNFTSAYLGFNSDLSSDFEYVYFEPHSSGIWGGFDWGNNVIWGGEGDKAPLRTYIPAKKQRCRFIGARFKHTGALENFQLYGISLSYNLTSDRAYR